MIVILFTIFLFCYISIRTVNGIISGVIVPLISLINGIPPRLGASESYACEATTTRERIISNSPDAIGDYYARKATAIIERILNDTRDAVGDFYTRKATAIIERITTNTRDAVGDFYARKATAVGKRIITNTRDASIRGYNTIFTACN